ncbi:MAG: CpaF family protein [Planctomycetota bacterium]|jgi:pilus assembly protein CpaF|nr:CpaF family protein [Planctomycetota bacterium]
MSDPLKKKNKRSSAHLLQRLRYELLVQLDEVMDSQWLYTNPDADNLDEWKDDITETLTGILRERKVKLRGEDKFLRELLRILQIYGPISGALLDPTVSEIMIVGPEKIYVEREGKLDRIPQRLPSENASIQLIRNILHHNHREIEEGVSMIDARLSDGSRLNAVFAPVAVEGSMLTIRKFRQDIINATDLVDRDTLSPAMVEFLQVAVESHLNIIVGGGTGSGKTTMLNVLSSYIPEGERIITIEDTAELQLSQDHVGRMEVMPPNRFGEGGVPIDQLFRNSLRMRPDRIVVGECRGKEAFDMLQAMNTGHDGSMTTLHANSARDILTRLENMVLMAGYGLPTEAVRRQIGTAIHLLFHMRRFPDGSRKLSSITEITGLQGDTISTQELFTFREEGRSADGTVQGRFLPASMAPKFFDRLREEGKSPPVELFR